LKVFVTGATGFIGSHLVKRLLRDGASVKALARDSSNVEELKKLGVEIIIGDVTDKISLKGVMKGSDICYHLGNVSRC